MIISTQHLGPTADAVYEASKLPLDVAVYNSSRATNAEERMKRALGGILVVGGGLGCVPGSINAMETRLQAIAHTWDPSIERVNVLHHQRDVDPRFVMWKGGSVLARMDGVSDMWVTSSDWVSETLNQACPR